MLPEEVLFSVDCLVHQSDRKIGYGLSHPKEVLHVQSISHWTPASIGPSVYQVGEVMYLAGQIALVPYTMKLVSDGIQTEASMSLSHTLKILEATHRGDGLHYILMTHCYVTSSKLIATALDTWQKNLRTHKKEVAWLFTNFTANGRELHQTIFRINV